MFKIIENEIAIGFFQSRIDRDMAFNLYILPDKNRFGRKEDEG